MELNIAILLRLLLAHIISDFMLQSKRMNDGKRGNIENQEKQKCVYQLSHSLIHAAISYGIVAQWDNWSIPLIIFTSHLIIDYIKSSRRESLSSFIIDQIAHIAVIVGIWLLTSGQCAAILDWLNKTFASNNLWITIIAYTLVLKPTSIMLGLFFKQWKLFGEGESLPDAGKWIGYMERVLILTFVITDNIEAVGFLLAAKSVFRFGELKGGKDRKTTEYVLIGTLASFAVSIIIGLGIILYGR